jgi:hypothetical protein
MKAKLCVLTASLCLALASAAAQGAVPASVTPAWVLERQFGQEKEARRLDVFFIGYDYPSLSGPLAPYLEAWKGPVNFTIGFEGADASNFLMGLEGEFLVDIRDKSSRFLFHDMMMLGYSLDLGAVRLNLGCRIGLSLVDVTDDANSANSFTGLGAVLGPEASIYLLLAPKTWLWARGRYARDFFLSMDDSLTTPIALGNDRLDCASLEAGLAFKL